MRPVTGLQLPTAPTKVMTLCQGIPSMLYYFSLRLYYQNISCSEGVQRLNDSGWSWLIQLTYYNSKYLWCNSTMYNKRQWIIERQKIIVSNNSCWICGALHWMPSDCKTIECTPRMHFSNISFFSFRRFLSWLSATCFIDGQFIDIAGSFSRWVSGHLCEP